MENQYEDFVASYIEAVNAGEHDKLAEMTTNLKDEDKSPALTALIAAMDEQSDEFKTDNKDLIEALNNVKGIQDRLEAEAKDKAEAEENTTEATSEGEAEACDPEVVEPEATAGNGSDE